MFFNSLFVPFLIGVLSVNALFIPFPRSPIGALYLDVTPLKREPEPNWGGTYAFFGREPIKDPNAKDLSNAYKTTMDFVGAIEKMYGTFSKPDA